MAEQPTAENHYAHAPMPYIVVFRAVLTEDEPAERFERSVLAYSLYEAVHAAVVEAVGVLPDAAKVTIESVRPDVVEYWKLAVNRLTKA